MIASYLSIITSCKVIMAGGLNFKLGVSCFVSFAEEGTNTIKKIQFQRAQKMLLTL